LYEVQELSCVTGRARGAGELGDDDCHVTLTDSAK
jgi:hypothetical protein